VVARSRTGEPSAARARVRAASPTLSARDGPLEGDARLGGTVVDGCTDVARVHGGHPDPIAVLGAEGIGVAHETPLAHAVGRGERRREEGEAGGHVHHAPAGLEQRGHRSGRYPPGTADEDLQARTEVAMDLGIDRGELLASKSVFLFVEGRNDQVVLETLCGPELHEYGIAVIPVHSSSKLKGIIDAEILLRYSSAPAAAWLDNVCL